MIGVEIRGSEGIRTLHDRFARLAERLRDLGPLAERIRLILDDDVRFALRSGSDRDADRVADIAPATVDRRRRAGRGTGPGRVPDESSSFLTAIRTSVEEIPHGYLVRLRWEGMDFLRFHVTGTSRMPARDPVGVTPGGRAMIRRAVDEWVQEAWEGAA